MSLYENRKLYSTSLILNRHNIQYIGYTHTILSVNVSIFILCFSLILFSSYIILLHPTWINVDTYTHLYFDIYVRCSFQKKKSQLKENNKKGFTCVWSTTLAS